MKGGGERGGGGGNRYSEVPIWAGKKQDSMLTIVLLPRLVLQYHTMITSMVRILGITMIAVADVLCGYCKGRSWPALLGVAIHTQQNSKSSM